jgi:hypothetical protein
MPFKWQFAAEEVVKYELRGNRSVRVRSVRLTFKIREYEKKPRAIYLTEKVKLDEFLDPRYPFSYEYQNPSYPERRYPLIKIVAAPGVSIKFENWDHFLDTPNYFVPKVEIIRVQDPQAVPAMASNITALYYCTPQQFNYKNIYGSYPNQPSIDFVIVERFPDQVVIHHPSLQRTMLIEVASLYIDTRHAEPKDLPPEKVIGRPGMGADAEMRFAYEIDEREDALGRHSPENPLVTIVKTNNVTVTEVSKRDNPYLSFFKIYNVGENINDVPVQGQHIEVKKFWTEYKPPKDPDPLYIELARFGADLAISAIPVAGDVADIGEFVYGLATGEDKWGRKLGTSDLVLMGIGAIIPFVGSAALRGGKALVRRFDHKAKLAEELVLQFEKAGMTARDKKIIDEMIQLAKKGKNPFLNPDLQEAFHEVLKRTRGKAPSASDFLNAGGTGFSHPELQEFYQKYRQARLKAGETPKGPIEWTTTLKTGRESEILVKLLGKDYAKGLGNVCM